MASVLPAFMEKVTAAANLQVYPTRLDDSSSWSVEEGRIRHRTGRFFDVGAVTYERGDDRHVEQPMIFQPEIGTLGFLIHRTGGSTQVLVNAKVEPGNIGPCQLAPSCQATESNQERVHGGAPTPCYTWFDDPDPKAVLSDTRQSEQGTRFWQKLNRNVIVVLDDEERASINPPPTHQWADLDEVLRLLPRNFSANTDARSVLVTCDWAALAGREPFVSSRNEEDAPPLAEALFQSFHKAPRPEAEVAFVLDRLDAARTNLSPSATSIETIDIRALSDWSLMEDGLHADPDGEFDVRHYGVEVNGREVARWDQPFVQSHGPGHIVLCCAPVDGVPRFLFRLRKEVGLAAGAELSPTFCAEPGAAAADVLPHDPETRKLREYVERKGTTWMQSRQSEEGGRFFRDVNHYRIVGLPHPPNTLPSNFIWLSLQAVQRLALRKQIFTNEARSTLSLLLRYL